MGFVLSRSLFGRDAEVTELAAALEDARAGRGRLVFLVGEAGAGKSRLAREILEIAAGRGAGVLAGRASESVVQMPYRPLAEALIRAARDGLNPDGPLVAGYRSALGRLVPEWYRADDGEAEASAIIVAEALIRLLAQPHDAATVLLLEDLQWADPETLAVMEYLADNVDGSRILCLATVRELEQCAALEMARSLATRRAADLITVPGLSDSAAHAMAAECLGCEDVPEWARKLLSQSDGLPYAIEELLAAAAASGPAGQGEQIWPGQGTVPEGVPASIEVSVARRLAECGPHVGDILTWAAMLGSHFDPGLLPALAGTSKTVVLDALGQARDAMLITPAGPAGRTLKFRHSLTLRAVLATLLPPDRAYRSARAARAIEDAYPDLPGAYCERAARLHAAAGSHARAATLMQEVGNRALRQGALRTAAASLETARQLASEDTDADPDLTSGIDLLLFQTFAAIGDRPRAVATARQLTGYLDETEIQPRRRALIMIATARTRHEHNRDAARAQLASAQQLAARLHDTELTCQARLALAQCMLDCDDPEQAAELAHQALTAAQSAGRSGWSADIATQALHLIGVTHKPRDLAPAIAAFEQARQIAQDSNSTIGRINALYELGTIQMLQDGSGDQLDEGRGLAQDAGAISATSLFDIRIAILAAVNGEVDRAEATARECEGQAAQIQSLRAQALAITVQAFAHAIRGDRAAAEEQATRAEKLLPGNPEIRFTNLGLVRVTAALFCDDLAEALRNAAAAAAYEEAVPAIAPRMAWGLYPLVHAASGQDGSAALDRARATAVAVKWNHGFFAHAEAVLAGRAGHDHQAVSLADQGDALLAPFDPRWARLARRLVAESALRDGWGEPVRWLRETAVACDAAGYQQLAASCRRALRQAGESVPRAARTPARQDCGARSRVVL
jgi:hypothetical protein